MQRSRVAYHAISHVSFVFSMYTNEPLGDCVYLENASDKWDIAWYTTRKRCITILYHAIENTEVKTCRNFGWNKIAAHHGKVGYNTVEYTMVFLHSNCLYFLGRGIKVDIKVNFKICMCHSLNSYLRISSFKGRFVNFFLMLFSR